MRKIYTLLTDNGPRYAAFHGERDFFITAACSKAHHAAAVFGWDAGFARENAALYVLDVRSETIARAEKVIARLERGMRISLSDALVLDSIYDFLRATIAPHQHTFPFLDDRMIERWIQELGLRKGRYASWDTDCILGDGCLWRVIDAKVGRVKYANLSKYFFGPKYRPSRAQKILAGRYLRCLGYVGRLFGPDRLPPEEIVAAWAGKNRKDGNGPSLIDKVLTLLALCPDLFERVARKKSPMNSSPRS